jgi:intracellular septation protein A
MSPVTVTVAWGLLLIIAWLWRPRRTADPSAAILLVAFAALGAWALWFGLYARSGEPAGFAFWKPTVMYWTLAAIAMVAPLLGSGYPVKSIVGTYFALSNNEWRWINRAFAAVYLLLGGVNLLVAREASYGNWVGFKFSCMMYVLIIVVFRLNFVWLPILADVSVHLYRRVTAACRNVSSWL